MVYNEAYLKAAQNCYDSGWDTFNNCFMDILSENLPVLTINNSWLQQNQQKSTSFGELASTCPEESAQPWPVVTHIEIVYD